jgi:hypothetical protein
LRWKREISEERSGELSMSVVLGSKCACIPILAYSANNAADRTGVAAYVAAIFPSGCHILLHVTLLSTRWLGVATWVPFFDNGKCVDQDAIYVHFALHIDEPCSGRYYFSSAHFGV